MLLAFAASLGAGSAGAQVRPAGDIIPRTALDTVTVTRRIDNLIGVAATASEELGGRGGHPRMAPAARG